MRAQNSILNFRGWLRYGDIPAKVCFSFFQGTIWTKTSELAKTDLEFGATGPESLPKDRKPPKGVSLPKGRKPPKGVGTHLLSLARPDWEDIGQKRLDDQEEKFRRPLLPTTASSHPAIGGWVHLQWQPISKCEKVFPKYSVCNYIGSNCTAEKIKICWLSLLRLPMNSVTRLGVQFITKLISKIRNRIPDFH